MIRTTSQDAATLLDILIDGFEKNESLGGFYRRELPMPDEGAAVRKFHALVEEARRWIHVSSFVDDDYLPDPVIQIGDHRFADAGSYLFKIVP